MGSEVATGADNVPPSVLTSAASKPVGASLKVKVIVEVAPDLRVATPLVIATAGARVSMVSAGVVPAPPLLPAASV